MNMSIEEIQEKIKTSFMERNSTERLVFSGILVVVAVISFELGGMKSGGGKERLPQAAALIPTVAPPVAPIGAPTAPELTPESVAEPPPEAAGDTETYVASKNSTKFHLPWCSGAKRISEENKVIYKSREEALAAGVKPAANCPGL